MHRGMQRVGGKAAAMLLVGAGFVMAPYAHADTRYAAPGGDGPAGTCPASNPCSLRDAAEHSNVDDGDLVLLRGGTYNLGTTRLQITARITMQPASAAVRPRITASAGDTIAAFGPLTLRRLAVKNFNAGGVSSALNLQAGGFIDRAEVFSSSLGGEGIFARGTTQIRNTVVEARGNFGAGITTGGPGTTTIANVTAVSQGPNGIGIRSPNSHGSPQSVTIVTTIAFGTQNDLVATDTSGADDPDVNVNVSWSNVVGTDDDPPDANISLDMGNQSGIPLFSSLLAGDFRQRPGSPTVDAGHNSFSFGRRDFEGSPRIQGGRVDIGADESTDPDRLLSLRGRRVRARRTLRVPATCVPAACKVRATALVKLPGPDARERTRATFGRGRPRFLRFRLGADLLDRLEQHLDEASLRVRARATDPVGFRGVERRRYRFR